MFQPSFWMQRYSIVALMLIPVSWIYYLAGFIRRIVIRPLKVDIPVICVGNAVAGGAGKTPTVIALVTYLQQQGYTPHILTRGYGGKLKNTTQVNLACHTSTQTGDEPLLLASHAPCWVGVDRRDSLEAAMQAGADCVVMDDGWQNPSLAKTCSILVMDGGFGVGNGYLLPAGALREPLKAALKRADITLMIGEDVTKLSRTIPFHIPQWTGTIIPCIPASLHARPVVAFCGIGRPEKFYNTLREHNVLVCATRDFADHHPYSNEDMNDLLALAKQHDAVLVTTQKDAVRLSAKWREHVHVVPITLTIRPEDALSSGLAWMKGWSNANR